MLKIYMFMLLYTYVFLLSQKNLAVITKRISIKYHLNRQKKEEKVYAQTKDMFMYLFPLLLHKKIKYIKKNTILSRKDTESGKTFFESIHHFSFLPVWTEFNIFDVEKNKRDSSVLSFINFILTKMSFIHFIPYSIFLSYFIFIFILYFRDGCTVYI